jgi:MarR family transcriptional regulator, organic hydroperoxide resistance regulator
MTRDQALDDLRDSFRGILASVRRLKGRDTHRPGEPSFAQFHLLAALREHGELSTSELAAAADLSPATVTQMLDGLEAMELVRRSRSTSDRRVVTCSLTDRGRTLITEKRARWEGYFRRELAGFSADEIATAAAVLDRMRAMYDEIDAEATQCGAAPAK